MGSFSPNRDDEDFLGSYYAGNGGGKHAGEKRRFEDADGEEGCCPPGATTGMILSLRENVQNYKDKITTCQADLDAHRSEVENWRSAFRNDPSVPAGSTPQPFLVMDSLRSLKSSELSLREELDKTKEREALLLVAFAVKEREIADLKSALRDLKPQLKPPAVQARRLLLDPAIHQEFTRLKKLNEEKEREVRELEESAMVVNFDPSSETGQMLIAKCRHLQRENDEIGELASGAKIGEVGRKLSLQKSQNARLRTQCQQLYEKLEGLTVDVERSGQMVFALEEQLDIKQTKITRLTEMDRS